MSKFIISAFADEAGASLAEQIEGLHRNNLKNIEIRNVDGINISQIETATAKEMAKTFANEGICVATIGSPIGKIRMDEDFDEHLEVLRHTLDNANIFGSNRIRLFSFLASEGKEVAAEETAVLERMDKVLSLCKEFGVVPHHENEKHIYGDITERCLKLKETFGDRLNLIFDPANFIQCGVHTPDAYALLKDKITYFHIKDALKSTGTVVPAGEGDGHIEEILADFSETHENTLLTVEPHLKNFIGAANLKDDESIAESARFATSADAFDGAVNALKNILEERGLSYE